MFVWQVVRNYATILISLVLGYLDCIEVVSNAMDLRGVRKGKTRIWYERKSITTLDKGILLLGIVFIIVGLLIKIKMPAYFWYPF